LLEQPIPLWELPREPIMLFQVAGFASDNQVVNSISWNIRACYSAQRECMIKMMLTPLDLLVAIPALALLPFVLLLDLFKCIFTLNGSFASTTIAFLDSSLLKMVYPVMIAVLSILLGMCLIICLSLLLYPLKVELTIVLAVLLCFLSMRLTIYSQLFSAACLTGGIEIPILITIRDEVFSSKRLHLFTLGASFVSLWYRFRSWILSERGASAFLAYSTNPSSISMEVVSRRWLDFLAFCTPFIAIGYRWWRIALSLVGFLIPYSGTWLASCSQVIELAFMRGKVLKSSRKFLLTSEASFQWYTVHTDETNPFIRHALGC
jgi:hypothetical protein